MRVGACCLSRGQDHVEITDQTQRTPEAVPHEADVPQAGMLPHHLADLLSHALPASTDPILRPTQVAAGRVRQHLALAELGDGLLQVAQVLGRADVPGVNDWSRKSQINRFNQNLPPMYIHKHKDAPVHQHRQVGRGRAGPCCPAAASRASSSARRREGLRRALHQQEHEQPQQQPSKSSSCQDCC